METQTFRYCLNGSTIRTTPLLEQIQVARTAGYEGIELWHDAIDTYISDGGTLSDIQKCLADNGLHVPTTIYLGDWFDAAEENYPTILEECRRRMEIAAALGAPHVIAGPPGGTANVPLGARRYQQLLEIGTSLGTLPAMEFLGFVDQINTIEDALEILRRTDHPNGTTVLDPFHIFRGGGSLASINKLQPHEIAVCHFNDAPATPDRLDQQDSDRVFPGEGHLDLQAYLDGVRTIGYQRWLSLELFREDLWAKDPKEVATTGLEKMRSVVENPTP